MPKFEFNIYLYFLWILNNVFFSQFGWKYELHTFIFVIYEGMFTINFIQNMFTKIFIITERVATKVQDFYFEISRNYVPIPLNQECRDIHFSIFDIRTKFVPYSFIVC